MHSCRRITAQNDMKEELFLLKLGGNDRLERVLDPVSAIPLSPDDNLQNKRIVFAVSTDQGGADSGFYLFLRRLRMEPDCMTGSMACLVVDGSTELYTKAAAQELVLAANRAGCLFPGRPLVEATGSLYNQHIQARNLGLGWEETYAYRVREMTGRLRTYVPPRFDRPRVLLLHASDKKRSNTLSLGRMVGQALSDRCEVREQPLLNGTVQDCRGCNYRACLHFAQNNTCFYGGVLPQEVLPAVREADLLLFLCPNYNDALGANLVALINRMTSLVVQQNLGDTYLGGVVVSGYSGSDLVARQLLGAMCLNRGCILPPDFCLLQTANDPGDALKVNGIRQRTDALAERLKRQIAK